MEEKVSFSHANRLLPYRGHGTIPVVSPSGNQSIAYLYLDAQCDYLESRICSTGAFCVVENESGEIFQSQTVQIAKCPSLSQGEEQLFGAFVQELFAIIRRIAEQAGNSIPLHLIYFDRGRTLLLEGLDRCLKKDNPLLTAFYDLLTHVEASACASTFTCLAAEIERFNYPVVCPSLQNVATHLGFRFSDEIKRTFRRGHFDVFGKDANQELFTRRARFSSQIPLEYFYAAWQALPIYPKGCGIADPYKPYRKSTPVLLEKLISERLFAMHHIVRTWAARGQVNARICKIPTQLDGFDTRDDKAKTFADAVSEYLLSERQSHLAQWIKTHLHLPEVRVSLGDSLIGRYIETNQSLESMQANRDHSDAIRRGQRWNQEGLRIRLRLDFATTGTDTLSLERALLLCGVEPGDRVLVTPRYICDERLPPLERVWQMPSPNQMMYGARADVESIELSRTGTGEIIGADVHLVMRSSWGVKGDQYVFPTAGSLPFVDSESYVVDACPSDQYLKTQATLVQHVIKTQTGATPGRHFFYERLATLAGDVLPLDHNPVEIRNIAQETCVAQTRFMDGLEFFARLGLLHETYGPTDIELIGKHTCAPLLLIQGPPGTAKTSKVTWALFARMQSAMLSGIPVRFIVVANTHAAADVLVGKIKDSQTVLERFRQADPDAFDRFFDIRLIDLCLCRVAPKDDVPDGVLALLRSQNKGTRERESNAELIRRKSACVVVGTPGGIYNLYKDYWATNSFLDRHGAALLVIDEASRITIPEAMLSGISLAPTGQILVLGDHRQLPPIQHHDWENERRRTFDCYDVYKSLFEFLLARNSNVPTIRLSRSYRCPAQVANFLREAIYSQDGINYYSTRVDILPHVHFGDPFVDAVLSPDASIILVIHNEAFSQTENAVERKLLAPILDALTDPAGHALDTQTGVGVVAIHRHQRAALLAEHPHLASAIHTVEKYQGSERDVILISATESDPFYLQEAGKFLLDLRRLCVAMSRAKKKVVLVASRTIFQATRLLDDETIWQSSIVWQRLLRQHCTQQLWSGEQAGHQVSVWGNCLSSHEEQK